MSSDSPYKSTRSRTRVANQNNSLVHSQGSLEVISSTPITSPQHVQSQASTQATTSTKEPQLTEQPSVMLIEPTTEQLSSNARRNNLSAPTKRAPPLSSSEMTIESTRESSKKAKNQQSDEQSGQQHTVIGSKQFKERHSTISLENDVTSNGCLFVRTDTNLHSKLKKAEIIKQQLEDMCQKLQQDLNLMQQKNAKLAEESKLTKENLPKDKQIGYLQSDGPSNGRAVYENAIGECYILSDSGKRVIISIPSNL